MVGLEPTWVQERTGQAEVGAGAAERRAEEHRQQPCSVWYISLPAGVTGTAGSQLQHKADLPETAQPKDHTGHAFVCCFSSAAAGNPLPMGGGWLGLGMLLAAPDLQQDWGCRKHFFSICLITKLLLEKEVPCWGCCAVDAVACVQGAPERSVQKCRPLV